MRVRVRLGLALLVLAAALGTTAAAVPHASGRAGATQRRTGPRVVGLGDSVMAGTHCGCNGIVARYAAREHRRGHAAIVPVNLGSNGATTTSLAKDLRDPRVLDRVRTARVVLVIVGANDLLPQLEQWQAGGCPASCYGPAVEAMGTRLGQVLATIGTARAGRADPGQVLVLDYWNVFQDGHQAINAEGHALVRWGRKVSRLANTAICSQSTANADRCVDLSRAFFTGDGDPTDLLAADGDHPNARGVDLIVRRLAAATPAGTF